MEQPACWFPYPTHVLDFYANVINSIATFVEPTSPTNIITNVTILIQFSIKQGLKVFVKKSRMQYKNNCSSFMTAELLNQISLRNPDMNNKERSWHT